MDQTNQQTRFGYQRPAIMQNVAANVAASVTTVNFPTITDLFVTAWVNLKKTLLGILIVNSIGLLSYAGLGVVFVVLITLFGFIPFLKGSVFSILTLILLALGVIGFFIISNAILAANIYILNDLKEFQLKPLMLKSLKISLPMLVVSVITTFIIFGGLFLLLLPGIIFAMFLIFTPYIMLLENKNGFESMKRSILLVAKSFGDVFVRIIILVLIPVLVSLILKNFFSADDSSVVAVNLLSFIFNLFYGWFALAYTLNLYKEIRQGVDANATARIRPIMGISLIGYIAALAVGGIFYLYSSRANQIPTLTTTPPDNTLLDLNATQPLPSIVPSPLATASSSASPKTQPVATASAKINTSTNSATQR